jgi:hypothetical protein
MNDLVVFVVLSAATYRIARFIVLDSLWDDSRNRLLDWLTTGVGIEGESRPLNNRTEPEQWRQLPFVRRKTAELLGCPWCVSLWIAGGVLFVYWLITDDHGPVPGFLYWPALSAGALTFWAIADSD